MITCTPIRSLFLCVLSLKIRRTILKHTCTYSLAYLRYVEIFGKIPTCPVPVVVRLLLGFDGAVHMTKPPRQLRVLDVAETCQHITRLPKTHDHQPLPPQTTHCTYARHVCKDPEGDRSPKVKVSSPHPTTSPHPNHTDSIPESKMETTTKPTSKSAQSPTATSNHKTTPRP
jgi:hypothetical protein